MSGGSEEAVDAGGSWKDSMIRNAIAVTNRLMGKGHFRVISGDHARPARLLSDAYAVDYLEEMNIRVRKATPQDKLLMGAYDYSDYNNLVDISSSNNADEKQNLTEALGGQKRVNFILKKIKEMPSALRAEGWSK